MKNANKSVFATSDFQLEIIVKHPDDKFYAFVQRRKCFDARAELVNLDIFESIKINIPVVKRNEFTSKDGDAFSPL